MTHGYESEFEDDFVEAEFIEDIFVTDLGLTWLASQWLVLEEFYREHFPSLADDPGPVTVWLMLAETSLDQFDRSKAAQLGQDIQRLLRSPLPDETIRTVWLAATHGILDPDEHGMTARTWLRRIEEAWLARVHQDDPAFVPSPPQPVVDEELRRAVIEVIHAVAGPLGPASETPPYGVPATGLVPALERVVTEACADLGYRLFLRAVKAYFVPVPSDGETYARFVALGERFGYPRWVVREGLNDRTD
ncbi:hypothetical protein ACFYW8_19560 [Streptomyces sp. NPDC002742]|uniref:hypothetical protein n=1 Tax=Streptomyces sp. NPDC002742 TaxID=3364663 RepID=UPI00369589D0